MEKKIQEQKENQTRSKTIWDCGSSLYDSFELKSFERQLDSAITSRTMSMPHLTDRRVHLPPPGPHPNPISRSKPSRFSRSFHKLLKSVFGPKQDASSSFDFRGSQDDGVYVVRGSLSSLSTIAEVADTATEYGGVSPDFAKSPVKTAAGSEAPFTAASVGISCA